MENVKKENEFLELQNEALSTTLDSKEAVIRDLEDNIMVCQILVIDNEKICELLFSFVIANYCRH